MTKLRPIASLSGFRVAVEAPPARGISFPVQVPCPVASSYQIKEPHAAQAIYIITLHCYVFRDMTSLTAVLVKKIKSLFTSCATPSTCHIVVFGAAGTRRVACTRSPHPNPNSSPNPQVRAGRAARQRPGPGQHLRAVLQPVPHPGHQSQRRARGARP
jgi:hypothetical protein